MNTVSEARRCVDCGVRITIGRRCTVHHRAHQRMDRWRSSDCLGVNCSEPGRLEEIFAVDLAEGETINEIALARGFRPKVVAEALTNLVLWLKTRERSPRHCLAAMVIERALDNFDFRVAPLTKGYQ